MPPQPQAGHRAGLAATTRRRRPRATERHHDRHAPDHGTPCRAGHACLPKHIGRNLHGQTRTGHRAKNAKNTTNTQLPESHCLAAPRAIPAGIMRQTAPPNGPFGNATWPIRQCNTARKTAKTSPYSNAICRSSDHATRQMSQPTSAPLPKIHGTLSPQTIFRAFPFVLISKKTRPRRRRRSPQPKTKRQRRRIVTQRRTDTNRHLCIRPWPRATAAPGIQQPRKEKPTEFSFQLNHSSRRTSYS